MTTIWKYPLQVTDVQWVSMPEGARLLYVDYQAGDLSLWAMVDSKAPLRNRLIAVVGTGNPAPTDQDGASYVGTAISGSFVWHVFDGGEQVTP